MSIRRIFDPLLGIISLAFCLISFGTAFSADIHEIHLNVTKEGFLLQGEIPQGPIPVSRNTSVRVIFEYVAQGPDSKTSSGSTHEFALMFDSGEEIYSDPISEKNKRSQIEFFSGKKGQRFEIFCIIGDCDGMENLIDLFIVSI